LKKVIFFVLAIAVGAAVAISYGGQGARSKATQTTIVPLSTYTVNLGGYATGTYIKVEVAIKVPSSDSAWFGTAPDGTPQMVVVSNIINNVFLHISPIEANNPAVVADRIRSAINAAFGSDIVRAVYFPLYEMQ